MKKLIVVLVWGIVGGAVAQQTNLQDKEKLPPLPSPIVRRAPDLSQWTIQLGNASSLASGADSHTNNGTSGNSKSDPSDKTTIIKSGAIYLISENDAMGRKWEKWNVNGRQVTFEPNTNQAIVRTSGSSGTTYTNFSSSDFSGFSWVSDQNYIDFKEIRGRKCYLFRMSVKDPQTGEVTILTAAVDGETQMPVFSAINDVVTTYRFGAPPSTPLSVPPKVLRALTQASQGLAPLPRRFRAN